MAHWRIVANGLEWKSNPEDKRNIGSISADTCEILPSGALCFYMEGRLVEAFEAHSWKNVSKEDEEEEEATNVANKTPSDKEQDP